jgi:putative protease
VTVNVAIRDDEMPLALALVRRAWLLGADAFIIQDWGLLLEVSRRWPELPCHLSTQANVHDVRGVEWSRAAGAERVTTSRELSLGELAELAGTGVPIECFCHGAICICYSGVCQMSSSVGDRSANRGMCAQPCRLPYELVDEHANVLSRADWGRPLCPRDYHSFDALDELVDTRVASLKVEGRLKGPDYVRAVIQAYRAQLDDIALGRVSDDLELSARRMQLKRAFNRDFTDAYLKGTSGSELMSYERSNNRGELVGEVVSSRDLGSIKRRRGGERGGRARVRTMSVVDVDVRLNKPVGKGDLLELRPIGDPTQFVTAHAPDDAQAGGTITVRTSRSMERGALVRVIRSQEAMEAGARAAQSEVPRRRAVTVGVRARLGEPFAVTLATADGLFEATATGFVVEPARTRPVSEEDLVSHVGRMGASWFEPTSFAVELDDGCGMGFAAVHEVRARACELLEQAILEPYRTRELSDAPSRATVRSDLARLREQSGLSVATRQEKARVEVVALVSSAQAARTAMGAGADAVYASSDALGVGDWPEQVVPVLDEVCRAADHERLDRWVARDGVVAVGNVSHLALAAQRGAHAEVRGCVPVHNESCLVALERAGACGFWLSPELSLDEMRTLVPRAGVPVGVLVAGRVRAMTCEHCVLQVADACCGNCARCRLRGRQTYLRDGSGTCYPVRTDLQGRSRVYGPRPIDLVPHVTELVAAGVSRLLVDGTLMDDAELAMQVRRVVRAREGDSVEPLPGASTGHLFSPVS